ncbi:MAG: outer membrane lipoprotein carrier protein LolA [Chitinophagales bacterium]
MKQLFSLLFTCLVLQAFTQGPAKTYIQDEADIALKKMSTRYEAFKTIKADFKLVVTNPKLKPTDNEAKLTDTIPGSISLKGEKFKIVMPGQEIFCDGKNIWTYLPKEREVQVDLFEETDDVFSPSKLFSFYKTGFSYQVKEKKTVAGKKILVAEMSPVNKKTSYFKIDVSINDSNAALLESKIYAKNGSRYLYKITAEKPDVELSDAFFTFDAAKYPGVKVIDLR